MPVPPFQPQRRHVLGMGVSLGLAATPTMVSANEKTLLPPEVQSFDVPLLQRARLAVVQVFGTEEDARFPGPGGGGGSGFVVSAPGNDPNTIVTNAHVCEGKNVMFIRTYEGAVMGADVVRTNALSDVALLRANGAHNLPVLPLSETMPPFAAPVVAIGAPHGYAGTVTRGHVSGGALGQDNAGVTYRDDDPVDYIQHDAPINPGNSGGPLLSPDGIVLGINTAIPDFTASFSGIGLATPALHITRELHALQRGDQAPPWLGLHVQQIAAPMASALGVTPHAGLLVAGVVPDGPAHRAGLEAGDILASAENRRLTRLRDLGQIMLTRHAGDTIGLVERMTIKENRPTIATAKPKPTITLRLEVPAKTTNRSTATKPVKTPLAPGFTVQASRQTGLAVIDYLDPRSAASDKGLAVGDEVHQMNRRPIARTEDMETIWRESHEDHVAVLVERAGDRPLHMLLPRYAPALTGRGNQTDEITRLF
ncbi:MAG: trypsin-like peptidase domain-containing protein [Pseudomonadota bacterium]